jgi:hypothetical protein
VRRGLADAHADGLSPDGRFLLAYGAALALARLAVAHAGWRVKGHGAHATAFEGLVLAMGSEAAEEADDFEACRQRRNLLACDAEGVVTEVEARELVERVWLLEPRVLRWCSIKK